jgi:transcriptional regulator with XRE-family HTH domain
MNIGKVIKSLRQEKGFTQMKLAKMCNITQTSLSQIESGSSRPSPQTLQSICKNLETPEPIMHLLSMEEKDVPVKKLDAYRLLFPVVQKLIGQILISGKNNS